MASRAAASSKPMTGLLGKEGLGPRGDGGQAEATLREGNVELLMGKPLQAALPKEIADGADCRTTVRCATTEPPCLPYILFLLYYQ